MLSCNLGLRCNKLKGKILVVVMLSLLASVSVPWAVASSSNGSPDMAIDKSIIRVITTSELAMSVNCAWNPFNTLTWGDGDSMPPLPGTGWASQIVSINIAQPMSVGLCVTDAYLKGDYFEVWEVNGLSPTQGQLLGTTPSVPKSDQGTTSNPDVAFVDPSYSHGVFGLYWLAAGKHYFAIREVGHNWGSGGLHVKFCSPVPYIAPSPVGGVVANTIPVTGLIFGYAGFAVVLLGVVSAAAIIKRRRV